MAFSITVHRRSDDALYRAPPADGGSDDFDRWTEECQRRWLYENPLGADGTVFEFWHVPAHELGLPLIGAIYNDGLLVAGPDLGRLSRELDVLERFWRRVDFSGAAPLTSETVNSDGTYEVRLVRLHDHLRERLGYLRAAIRIAEERDGVVGIS